MKQPRFIDTLRLPYAEFGAELKREVRVIASPQTTGESRMTLVSCVLPPGAVSENHVHDDYDEYIQFQTTGEVELDGVIQHVPAQGVIHVKAGLCHECRNTSGSKTLYLTCIFLPPLVPYGLYPDLMKRTKDQLQR